MSSLLCVSRNILSICATILIIAVLQVNSSTMSCDYKNWNYWQVGSLYSCVGQVSETSDQSVTEIFGSHVSEKSNDDVRGLYLNSPDMTVFPKNIDQFFFNIEAICVEVKTNIRELNREDLAPFKKLRQLHMFGHKIQNLKHDLFLDTPLIEHISFAGNPLKHVAHETFDGLKNLQSLYVLWTTCINEQAENDSEKVKQIIQKLIVNCPPSSEMIRNEIMDSDEFKFKIEQLVMEKTNPLTWKMFQIEEKLEKLNLA